MFLSFLYFPSLVWIWQPYMPPPNDGQLGFGNPVFWGCQYLLLFFLHLPWVFICDPLHILCNCICLFKGVKEFPVSSLECFLLTGCAQWLHLPIMKTRGFIAYKTGVLCAALMKSGTCSILYETISKNFIPNGWEKKSFAKMGNKNERMNENLEAKITPLIHGNRMGSCFIADVRTH